MKFGALCGALAAIGAQPFIGAVQVADWFPVKVKSIAADDQKAVVDYQALVKASQS